MIEALKTTRARWNRSCATEQARVSARAASLSLLPLVAMLALSLSGVWMSVRTGDETSRFSGLEVPVLRYALIAAVGVIALGVLGEGVLLRRWPLSISAVGGAVVLVVAGLLLLLEELAASLVPRSFLPTSVRRLTLDVYGGGGIWVAVLTSLAVTTGSRIDGGAIGVARALLAAVERLPVRLLAMLGAGGAGIGIAAWSRYQPWAGGSAANQHVEVPGWSLPLIGPASLAAVLVLGAAAASLVVRWNLLAALVLTTAGWLCSFLGAATLVAASTLARVEVDRFLPGVVTGRELSVGPRWGAWVMFAAGGAVAGCGAGIVAWLERQSR